MKKYCISFVLFITISFLSRNLYSQSEIVHYSYDVTGNRLERWVTIEKISKNDSVDSIHQDTIVHKNTTQTNEQNISISLFPNPTQGLLDLKITGMEDGESAEYVFVSVTGQELTRKKTGLTLTRIDICTFPPGIYLVNVSIGEKKEIWKIVKQQ